MLFEGTEDCPATFILGKITLAGVQGTIIARALAYPNFVKSVSKLSSFMRGPRDIAFENIYHVLT